MDALLVACVSLVRRYCCKCLVTQFTVLRLPSSMLAQIAIMLMFVSHLLAVHALRAQRCAAEAASLSLLLVQLHVALVMKSSALHGDAVPCRNAGHHECGIESSLGIVICWL